LLAYVVTVSVHCYCIGTLLVYTSTFSYFKQHINFILKYQTKDMNKSFPLKSVVCVIYITKYYIYLNITYSNCNYKEHRFSLF